MNKHDAIEINDSVFNEIETIFNTKKLTPQDLLIHTNGEPEVFLSFIINQHIDIADKEFFCILDAIQLKNETHTRELNEIKAIISSTNQAIYNEFALTLENSLEEKLLKAPPTHNSIGVLFSNSQINNDEVVSILQATSSWIKEHPQQDLTLYLGSDVLFSTKS